MYNPCVRLSVELNKNTADGLNSLTTLLLRTIQKYQSCEGHWHRNVRSTTTPLHGFQSWPWCPSIVCPCVHPPYCSVSPSLDSLLSRCDRCVQIVFLWEIERMSLTALFSYDSCVKDVTYLYIRLFKTTCPYQVIYLQGAFKNLISVLLMKEQIIFHSQIITRQMHNKNSL